MIEATQLHKALPPLESLLDFKIAQLLVVDRDQLVDKLKGVEHLVDPVRIDYLGPLCLRHRLSLLDCLGCFLRRVFVQKPDLSKQLLVDGNLCEKRPGGLSDIRNSQIQKIEQQVEALAPIADHVVQLFLWR